VSTIESHQPTQEDIDAGYERKDINIKKILTVVVVIAFLLVVSVVWLNNFFVHSKEQMYYEEVLKPPSKKLEQLHEREQKELHTYAVLDSSKGIYRIPINRAMKLVAEEEFQHRVRQSGTH